MKNIRYEKTKITGIRRDTSTGIYYANKKYGGGRVFGGSLETTDLKTAEKKLHLRLAQLAEEQPEPPSALATEAAELTLGQLVELYLTRLKGGGYGKVDSKTIEKQEGQLKKPIRLIWSKVPELVAAKKNNFNALRPRDVAYDDLIAWRKYFTTPKATDEDYDEDQAPGCGYSADYFNKTVSILRRLFKLAIELGSIREKSSPVERLKPEPDQREEYKLPTAEKFAEILAYNDQGCHNWSSRHTRDLIEAVSWTGLRRGEARALKVEYVDLKAGVIRLPAKICKGCLGKKRGRNIPILPDARALFERLVRDAAQDGSIFYFNKTNDAGKFWLRAACKRAGWTEKFTLHSVRHYFATRCIEAGIPIPTVADWLGHNDKGKLLLTVYHHICQEHSLEIAKSLTGWKIEKATNIVPLKVA